jgi:hypothetical protein
MCFRIIAAVSGFLLRILSCRLYVGLDILQDLITLGSSIIQALAERIAAYLQ